MEDLIAYRIKNARKLHLLSQQEVADSIGVSKQMISKYEKGLSIPDSTKLILLANLFGQKVDYFFSPFKIELGTVNFRKKSKFSKKRQESLKELIKIELENYLWLEEILSINSSFDNPLQRFTIHSVEGAQQAAAHLRKCWDIGMDSIHNIIQLLEDKEIKVIELEQVDNQFDGLACFVNNKYPIIVINSSFTVERKRFTLLHELGHLLLSLENCSLQKKEQFCDVFAAELLLPKHVIIEEIGGKRQHVTLPELIATQKKYGISIPAIIYKLVEIGVLNKEQHKAFYRKLNANAFLKEHVHQSRFETSEFSDKYKRMVYRALAEEKVTLSKASALLHQPVDIVRKNLTAL